MVTVTDVESSAPLVIAIDGPSGSGKSSTSRGVAERLGLAYLDTGAMYRAVAWYVDDRGLTDEDEIAARLAHVQLHVATDPAQFDISIDGTDVTEAIREPRISAIVSRSASLPSVRALLIAQQRSIIARAETGIVAEGRDITTVVAPQAQVRVLLTADPEARVARREAELDGQASTDEVTDQVIRRDADDAQVTEFTEAADGVIVLDTTHLSLSEVIDAICNLVPAT